MLSYKRYLNLNLLKKKNRKYSLSDYLPHPSAGQRDEGNHPNLHFVGSGRGAMEAIIDALQITPADTVLIPALVPEGLISPLRKKTVQTGLYKSNGDMSVDIDDLEHRLQNKKNVKAVVIIHFFGFPQDTKKIRNLCRKYNAILIEDCAQALFSKDREGNPLGSIGDISFFSLPKTIPVPDGAAICFNITGPPAAIKNRIKYRRSLFHFLAVGFHLFYLSMKKWELKMNDSLPYRVINYGSKVLYAFYYQALRWTPKPTNISGTTKKITASIDYAALIEKRSANADYFYRHIDRKKFHLNNPSYHINYILTGIPILSNHRTDIVRHLKKKGIECLSYVKRWYLLPEEYEKEYEKEKNFYHRHLLVPISENIGLDGMRTIVETLNEFELEP